MKKIIFGFMFLLIICAAFAQNNLVDELKENWDEIKNKELPGFTKKIFGDERINIYVTSSEGKETVIGLVVEDGKFKELSLSKLGDATLNVRGTEKIIKQIKDSKNPLVSFRKALNDETIDYSAVGIAKKIKFGAANFALKVAGWFGYGK